MQDRQERFLMVPYKLLSAAGYVDANGVPVKMNLTEKVIYAHLKNRFEFFNGLGKEYFDTQQAIADVCNMDVKSVGKILRKFNKDGLTTIYKKPSGNFVRHVYKNVPNLKLWYKGKEMVDKVDESEYPKDEGFVVTIPDVGYLGSWVEENDLSEYIEYMRNQE